MSMKAVRGSGRIVSLYERAPLRQLLDLDPIGAVDWIIVALARRMVRFLDGAHAAEYLDGPAVSSGWRGNFVFLLFWAMLIAGAAALFA